LIAGKSPAPVGESPAEILDFGAPKWLIRILVVAIYVVRQPDVVVRKVWWRNIRSRTEYRLIMDVEVANPKVVDTQGLGHRYEVFALVQVLGRDGFGENSWKAVVMKPRRCGDSLAECPLAA
jgi:hypothetical protein